MNRRGFLQALFGLAAAPAIAKMAPLLPEVPAATPAVSGFVPISEYVGRMVSAEELNGMWIAFMHESLLASLRDGIAIVETCPPILVGELGTFEGVRLIHAREIFKAPPCKSFARPPRPAYRQLLRNRWER